MWRSLAGETKRGEERDHSLDSPRLAWAEGDDDLAWNKSNPRGTTGIADGNGLRQEGAGGFV